MYVQVVLKIIAIERDLPKNHTIRFPFSGSPPFVIGLQRKYDASETSIVNLVWGGFEIKEEDVDQQ